MIDSLKLFPKGDANKGTLCGKWLGGGGGSDR